MIQPEGHIQYSLKEVNENQPLLVEETKSKQKKPREKCCYISIGVCGGCVGLVLLAFAIALLCICPFTRFSFEEYVADCGVLEDGGKMRRITVFSYSSSEFAIKYSPKIYSFTRDGKTIHDIWSMFNRSGAYVYESDTSSKIKVSTWYELSETDIPCPDINSAKPPGIEERTLKTCDKYTLKWLYNRTIWVEHETNYPVLHSINTDILGRKKGETLIYFWSFAPGVPKNDTYLQVPKGIKEVDLSDIDEESSSAKQLTTNTVNGLIITIANDIGMIIRQARYAPNWVERFCAGIVLPMLTSISSVTGVKERSNDEISKLNRIPDEDIPISFDARKKWSFCSSTRVIYNQGTCYGHWAIAAASSLSDRFCIATNGSIDVRLSPQTIISCYNESFGCFGGSLDTTWDAFSTFGLVSELCQPYFGRDSGCLSERCVNGLPPDRKYFARSSYALYVKDDVSATVKLIQKEIMENGPVEAAISVYSDLENYKGGIYNRSKIATYQSIYGMKIVGWGEENNDPYWIVVNSWGPDWGEGGTFRIRRGVNECGIEDRVIAGLPQID